MGEGLSLTRRELLQLGAVSLAAAKAWPRFSFWVFGLLKPQYLKVRSVQAKRLHVVSEKDSWMLEPNTELTITRESGPLQVSGPDEQPAMFLLEVPNVIRRVYLGRLSVCWNGAALVPVLTMECETAVASVVGAELPLATSPQQTLMAQAVVARSFLMGTPGPRHTCAFFCDTTHCQFLRSPLSEGDRSKRAAEDTTGLVLSSQGAAIAAQYSAACGGRTQAGSRDGYDYQSVPCASCRDHHLARRGHGWGLCQEGALALGRSGSSCASILSMYFPTASLSEM